MHDQCLIIEKDSLKPKTKQALLEENFHIEEVPFRPTAENFSRYFFERLKQAGFPVYEAWYNSFLQRLLHTYVQLLQEYLLALPCQETIAASGTYWI